MLEVWSKKYTFKEQMKNVKVVPWWGLGGWGWGMFFEPNLIFF
jgi:hypothetical protein